MYGVYIYGKQNKLKAVICKSENKTTVLEYLKKVRKVCIGAYSWIGRV